MFNFSMSLLIHDLMRLISIMEHMPYAASVSVSLELRRCVSYSLEMEEKVSIHDSFLWDT